MKLCSVIVGCLLLIGCTSSATSNESVSNDYFQEALQGIEAVEEYSTN